MEITFSFEKVTTPSAISLKVILTLWEAYIKVFGNHAMDTWKGASYPEPEGNLEQPAL